MLGTVLHYVRHYPARAVSAFASDPAGLIETLQDRIVQNREYRRPPCRYDVTPDWERRLHRTLNVEFPCTAVAEFHAEWPKAVESVAAKGINVGPESFNGYNDGDAALVRAIWCLIRHLKPQNVVETGVAHGFTSRFILEAMTRNGAGLLSSIDRQPLDPQMQKQIGIAVDERLKDRWTLIKGTSRRRLPGLLSRLGTLDLFVHDSLHTERNVCFELDHAWRRLKAGGALVIDDVDSNWGFHSFLKAHPVQSAFICEAEPVRPDTRRFNKKGLFGIVIKKPD